jgi:hypothetical protein
MISINRIAECYDGRGVIMPIGNVRAIIVHRTDLCQWAPENPHPIPNDQLDGPSLCKVFMSQPGLGTGSRPPYHVLIKTDGTAEQMLPLSVMGEHCITMNHRSLAVAVVGDFNAIQPSLAQWETLVEVVASWAPINGGLDVLGHTDVPGGSANPGKRCPGKYLPVGPVEMEVARRLPVGWRLWNTEGVAAALAADGWGL